MREQRGFHFPRRVLASALRPGEIVVDLFAGGGGASEALRQALGRDPDIAINHDEWAIGMHAANHPFTRHMCEDVWEADARVECGGRPVGWLHASPDCTHFSQAKGGQPRSRATRSLSWVVTKWAGAVRPRIISLENVEQIRKWGPLRAKRDRATGRVVRLDGTVAARGERVPIGEQFLVPDKRHEGRTWCAFIASLCHLGYVVEWRKLRACDYGAGTSRTRLFLIARLDGEPIRWPEPTHGPGLVPFVTAADCIDWSLPTRSIFDRPKPLAEATMRRIARGIRKFVLDAAQPFIVEYCAPVLTEHANASRAASWRADEPLRTQCANVKGGHFAVATATLVQTAHGDGDGTTKRRGGGHHDTQAPLPTIDRTGNSIGVAAATLVQTGYGEREGQAPRVPGLDKPLGTAVDGVKHAVVAAHLAKFRGDSAGSAATEPVPTITSGAGAARPAGHAHALGIVTAFIEQAAGGPNSNTSPPRAADEPLSTIVGKGCTQRLAMAHLMHASTSNVNGGRGRPDLPLRTILAGGEHNAIIECELSPEAEAGALRVAAFLVNYYGNGQALDLAEPADTITTRDRLALVTVHVRGVPYVIVDIGLRMLKPHELYAAQGFPADYIIDRTADGRAINGTRAVKMVGNSVSPHPLAALARANLDNAAESRAAA
ncbi:DNA (cytosine-5)-methyltransferase 1 [Dokdonella fugitiva]|uniref:DNA (cytosine-5-)-methyltransferase n=1 Tax=Dokdonella fugitiva TaxID=328517 RepID=A0A839EWF9_9GAMM|nr:DNA cytosine methyltransferase [Dokdonella fugitiva]MBA8886112.1 DNA (cytosine-5)-methyltransferase 1 [Dokdonella fugitiva]